MIRLQPMTEAEFLEYSENSIISYARTSPKYRDVDATTAIREVRLNYFTKIMPEGFCSKGHLLFSLFDEAAHVGYLHLGEVPAPGSKTLHAWDFIIFEACRGRGLGKRAMAAAGEKLKQLGYHRITLNVFGDNEVARGLYKAMGFQVTQLQMAADL